MANAIEVNFMCDPLVGVLWSFEKEEINENDEVVSSLMVLSSYTKNPCKLDLDLKNKETPPAMPLIVELPQLELKPFPHYLLYIFR